ncbi:probable peroxidase 61 [Humulus lupulus]|uniref:probable peroxidase 61 n=1 Tax=Humulus lupulus TaxID=3486 RepID=UPI002B40720A|nr:probable peroxidase 61 [Humulus lupulus]
MGGIQQRKGSHFLPILVVVVLSLCQLRFSKAANGLQKPVRLRRNFYKYQKTCKDVENYVNHQVQISWKSDKSIVAKLLRLTYSDCFVTGCDASILLNGPKSEKTALQNRGLGGFVLIDKIKEVLEERCPGVVSCADILQLATRDAVHLAGGPSYILLTGRRDGMTSSASSVDIPSPSMSANETLAYFNSKGLDVRDMATLLGAHTVGRTHCRNIEDRLYNFKGTKRADPTMDPYLVQSLRKQCPERLRKGQSDPLVYLNPESGNRYNFTESFYRRANNNQAVLGIDQQLLYRDDTKELNLQFANSFQDFKLSIALSMNRMGSINVLTGDLGEIRRTCNMTNKDNPRLK